MRILFLFNDYLQTGGERHSVETEIRALDRRDHIVSTLRVTNEVLSNSKLSLLATMVPNKSSFDVVKSSIDSFKPDIIHAENLFPRLGAGAILAIKRSGIPWVRSIRNYRRYCIAGTLQREGVSCTACVGTVLRIPGITHACYRDGKAASIAATSHGYWDRATERIFPPSTYIAVSHHVAETLKSTSTHDADISVVHNAVQAAQFPLPPMHEREIDCLFVGRLSEEKGVRTILQLAAHLPNRRFGIVGDGELAEDVAHASRELTNLNAYGSLPQADVGRIMSTTKVVLVPSNWEEPFGRVAAEALAFGALPLVSNRGGLPEIVKSLPFEGCVSGDWMDWAKHLEQILGCPDEELDLFSTAALARWQDFFSEGALADQLIAVYKSAISKRLV